MLFMYSGYLNTLVCMACFKTLSSYVMAGLLILSLIICRYNLDTVFYTFQQLFGIIVYHYNHASLYVYVYSIHRFICIIIYYVKSLNSAAATACFNMGTQNGSKLEV